MAAVPSKKGPPLILALGVIAVVLCLGLCGFVFTVNTFLPSTTPTPSTGAPASTSQPSRHVGLGSTLADWERVQGKQSRDDAGFKQYQGGSLIVAVLGDRLNYVERSYSTAGLPPLLDDAKKTAATIYPEDAVFVRTYTTDTGREVDLFKSESLAKSMPGEQWSGGEPGNFIVIYRVTSGRVTSFVVATGNNP
jgi:hypothetical protein